jgi:Raf kinase inhibitor-like YbhB/YbcL family protein
MPQPQPHQKTRRPSSRASSSAAPATIELTSPAFAGGGTIPKRFTGDGDDLSPPLTWLGLPPGTVSLALVCEDPDAPSGTFDHWLVWNISADETQLDEGAPAVLETFGLRQGENGFGRTGWAGPRPPPGRPHRYVFHLYALDVRIDLPSGASREDLDREIEWHILSEGRLIGMYGR